MIEELNIALQSAKLQTENHLKRFKKQKIKLSTEKSQLRKQLMGTRDVLDEKQIVLMTSPSSNASLASAARSKEDRPT